MFSLENVKAIKKNQQQDFDKNYNWRVTSDSLILVSIV